MKRSWLFSLVVSMGLVGCGGPFLMIPGGALRGEVVSEPIDDWSFVDDAFVDELEALCVPGKAQYRLELKR